MTLTLMIIICILLIFHVNANVVGNTIFHSALNLKLFKIHIEPVHL